MAADPSRAAKAPDNIDHVTSDPAAAKVPVNAENVTSLNPPSPVIVTSSSAGQSGAEHVIFAPVANPQSSVVVASSPVANPVANPQSAVVVASSPVANPPSPVNSAPVVNPPSPVMVTSSPGEGGGQGGGRGHGNGGSQGGGHEGGDQGGSGGLRGESIRHRLRNREEPRAGRGPQGGEEESAQLRRNRRRKRKFQEVGEIGGNLRNMKFASLVVASSPVANPPLPVSVTSSPGGQGGGGGGGAVEHVISAPVANSPSAVVVASSPVANPPSPVNSAMDNPPSPVMVTSSPGGVGGQDGGRGHDDGVSRGGGQEGGDQGGNGGLRGESIRHRLRNREELRARRIPQGGEEETAQLRRNRRSRRNSQEVREIGGSLQNMKFASLAVQQTRATRRSLVASVLCIELVKLLPTTNTRCTRRKIWEIAKEQFEKNSWQYPKLNHSDKKYVVGELKSHFSDLLVVDETHFYFNANNSSISEVENIILQGRRKRGRKH